MIVKNFRYLFFVLIIALSFGLLTAGCSTEEAKDIIDGTASGVDETIDDEINIIEVTDEEYTASSASSRGYIVYCIGSGCGGNSSNKPNSKSYSASDINITVVLPSSVNPPANARVVQNAIISFLDEDASSEDDSTSESTIIEADTNGLFNIPDEIIANSQNEDSQPLIVVSSPDGNSTSTSTTLPAVSSDSEDDTTPVALKIIPKEFVTLDGEYRIFHALKVMDDDRVVLAKNVTWNCDGKNNGIFTEFFKSDNGVFVICKSDEGQAGDVLVTASITAGEGLEDEAIGEVVSRSSLVTVQGTAYDTDGTTTIPSGYMVNFSLPSKHGHRPPHWGGTIGADGTYKVFLPNFEEEKIYRILIGTKNLHGAKLFKTNPETLTVSPGEGQQIDLDLTLGDVFVPFLAPPPVEKIIGNGWRQVRNASRPRYFEPFNGIRLLLKDDVADGEGKIEHIGMFKGWCYDKESSTVTITPPAFNSLHSNNECPNSNAREIITIEKTSETTGTTASYEWVNEIKPVGHDEYYKVGSGTVTDTITCLNTVSTVGSTPVCYISAIEAVNKHFFKQRPDEAAMTALWIWERELESNEEKSDEIEPMKIEMVEKTCSGDNTWTGDDPNTACGTGNPIMSYSIVREKSTTPIIWDDNTAASLLFSYYGKSTHFFKNPNGTIRHISNRICTEDTPCKVNTDHSGIANIKTIDSDDEPDGIIDMDFELLPWSVTRETRIVSDGNLSLKVRDTVKEFIFSINQFGIIKVIFPDESGEKEFPLL